MTRLSKTTIKHFLKDIFKINCNDVNIKKAPMTILAAKFLSIFTLHFVVEISNS